MAAVSGTIAAGGGQSAAYTPTQGTAQVFISGNGKGEVWLQELIPGGAWRNLTDQHGSFVLATPDVAVTYRVNAIGNEDDVVYYLGP